MRFCCNGGGAREQDRIQILKQKETKAGKAAARKARRLVNMMKIAERLVVADLTTGLSTFKRRISSKEVEALVDAGKIDEALDTIPWDKLPEDLSKLRDRSENAVLNSSKFAVETLPGVSPTFIIGTANPSVQRFLDNQTGLLITGIQEDSRRAVTNAIAQSLDNAVRPKQVGKLIKQSIGITEKQSQKIMFMQAKEFAERDELRTQLQQLKLQGKTTTASAQRIRAKLLTLTDTRIEQRAIRRSAVAQTNRVNTIARTEMTKAVNQGQLEVWGAAADEGLIERDNSFKVWVSVPDDRRTQICADLDGTKIPLDEQFFVNQTGENVDSPPAHPNCRSALTLVSE